MLVTEKVAVVLGLEVTGRRGVEVFDGAAAGIDKALKESPCSCLGGKTDESHQRHPEALNSSSAKGCMTKRPGVTPSMAGL